MAPKKQVDQVEARHGNELALKQEVAVADIIADIKANSSLSDQTAATLDRYLEKYKVGSLKAPAVTQLLRTSVGMDKVKESIERLVPGYTRSWSPFPHEHPIIV